MHGTFGYLGLILCFCTLNKTQTIGALSSSATYNPASVNQIMPFHYCKIQFVVEPKT
jgi:hypothetical protein